MVSEVFQLGTGELVVPQADLPQFVQLREVLEAFQLAVGHGNSLHVDELLKELLVALCQLSDLNIIENERCLILFRVRVYTEQLLKLFFYPGHPHS